MSRGGRHPIYDADTVRVTVDLGFGMSFDLGSCRIFGIHAPEMLGLERDRGLAARDFLRALLGKHPDFTVRTHKDKKNNYGRYLVEILLPGHTKTVNRFLVDSGHAVVAVY